MNVTPNFNNTLSLQTCECFLSTFPSIQSNTAREISSIAIIIFIQLFPELNARCKQIDAQVINKSKALLFHANLEDYFKKNIHFYQKTNRLSSSIVDMALQNEMKRAEAIIHLHTLSTVTIQELENREKKVWKEFLGEIIYANNITLVRNNVYADTTGIKWRIKKSDCTFFGMSHQPKDCPFNETRLILGSSEIQNDK